MVSKKLLVIAAIVGLVCGVLSNRGFLLGSWINLIFWGLAGIVLGFFVKDRKEGIWTGVVFGFFVTAAFLISGFKGAPDKIPQFALLALLLCAVGARCGWLLVLTGRWLKLKVKPV